MTNLSIEDVDFGSFLRNASFGLTWIGDGWEGQEVGWIVVTAGERKPKDRVYRVVVTSTST